MIYPSFGSGKGSGGYREIGRCNLRRPFYGWIIVGVSFLIGMTEAGVFQNVLSIFMKPMVHDFGWSRASVAGAIAFGSISGGLLSLVLSPMIDRHGPRMVAFCHILSVFKPPEIFRYDPHMLNRHSQLLPLSVDLQDSSKEREELKFRGIRCYFINGKPTNKDPHGGDYADQKPSATVEEI